MDISYWKKGGWLWALLVLTAVIVTPIGYEYYRDKSPKSIGNTGAAQAIEVTAEQYAQAYIENEDEANKLYLYKPLIIWGTVLTNSTSKGDSISAITLQAIGSSTVMCLVKKTEAQSLKIGQRVKIAAYGTGGALFGPGAMQAELFNDMNAKR